MYVEKQDLYGPIKLYNIFFLHLKWCTKTFFSTYIYFAFCDHQILNGSRNMRIQTTFCICKNEFDQVFWGKK